MKKTFHFQMPIDQKSIEVKSDGTLSIKGYASTKDQDRYGDIVDPKAFENTLETFAKNPIMLLQHDANKPIGRFPETSIDSKGLAVVGDVMYDEDECMKKIRDGILWAFSIGYIPKKYEIRNAEGDLIATEAGYEAWYDWEDVWYGEGIVRTIKELDLIEISVVSTPANAHAVFSMQKSVKSFFAQEAKEWKNKVIAEMKTIEEESTVDVEAEATDIDTPEFTDTPPVVDATDGEEIADVSQEALKVEVGETAGESPEVPEEKEVVPACETPAEPVAETVDTPETPEEKSVSFEKKALEDMQLKVAGLESKLAKSDEVSQKLIELVSAMNDEVKTLRGVIAKIPMKKGLATLVWGVDFNADESKSSGMITQMIKSAQKS